MRAKLLSLICVLAAVTFDIGVLEAKSPNIMVVVEEAEIKGGSQDTASSNNYWSVPGDVTNMAALLYGKTALESGVVSDFDWRRKPVKAVSLANSYQQAGYHTAFLGKWGMGGEAPFDPVSRGFDSVWFPLGQGDKMLDELQLTDSVGIKPLMASMPKDKPWFCVIRNGAGWGAATKLTDRLIQAKGSEGWVVIVLDHGSVTVSAANNHKGPLPTIKARTIGEIYQDLRTFLGQPAEEAPAYLFHHQGGWPLIDSPEKHRHRGALVLGEKFALEDGLKLYPMLTSTTPDKEKSLDIAQHTAVHQQLLTAHSEWWQRASKAINNPRPFEVGEHDHQTVKLTALDWRPTKIIHQDGSALASEPMVYQDKLIAILRGLKQNKQYKQSFPAYSGSWSLNIKRPGRYKITARILPEKGVSPQDITLGKLEGGQAYIKLGHNQVQLQVIPGASSVSALVDADGGVTDLECWFTGQLSLERELGAFFVEIQRVDDKKFNFKTKPNSSSTTP